MNIPFSNAFRPERNVDFLDTGFNAARPKSFATPGYYPPSVWSVQRPVNQGLARKLFPPKVDVDSSNHCVSAGTAHISGKPVDAKLQYNVYKKVTTLLGLDIIYIKCFFIILFLLVIEYLTLRYYLVSLKISPLTKNLWTIFHNSTLMK